MSDKIRPQHLERKAILYVRQSSAYQVTHNMESQKLQYAMQERLRQLGWREIEVVDEDLGRSAAGTVARTGFERMVSEVCLGKVGAVAAREVSRFARNSREWQRLVEVCRVVDTILIDQETIYAPRYSNDRLLLGLKGSLNEYELDLLRQRSVEARREKARRGELVVSAPVGYWKTEDQRLEKHPDLRVQQAVSLVFRKFGELGTVRQTLLWFLEHGLQLPTHIQNGELAWKRPSYRSLYRMLTSPVYGGAYAYGKTEQLLRYENGEPRHHCRRKPREQWLALIPNNHEGYVGWEEFERMQQAIRENSLSSGQTGALKTGPALLIGLLRCRRCGRKLMIRYTGNRHDVLRYACCRGWLDNGETRCIAFGGSSVDEAISKEILQVAQPAAVEDAVLASQEEASRRDDVLEALSRDLEAARYAAQRAQRQYDGADPENRLVASELEQRWNQALQRVRAVETKITQHLEETGDHATAKPEEFADLAGQLEMVWNDPNADVRLKKRIIRTLNSSQTPQSVVEAVTALARICSDDLIAGILNRNGLKTGRGNRWTRERVTALRSHHGITCFSDERRQAEGWMNLTEAAAFLGLSPKTVRLAVERGEISAEHPLPDGPWIFQKCALEKESTRALVEHVQHGIRTPAILSKQQSGFDFSST